MNSLHTGQSGFTRLELLIIVAVLAVLAAIATPAVSGAVSSFRTHGKDGDIKNVEAGVSRYRSENDNALPIIGSTAPTKSLVDKDGDKVIKVKVNTTATDTSSFPADTAVDVVCGNSSTAMAASLAQCFGALDFTSKLIPNYVKSAPEHSLETVTATADAAGSTVDLTITGVDSSGDKMELYLDADITSDDGLKVWNVDKDGVVIVLKSDIEYGKAEQTDR